VKLKDLEVLRGSKLISKGGKKASPVFTRGWDRRKSVVRPPPDWGTPYQPRFKGRIKCGRNPKPKGGGKMGGCPLYHVGVCRGARI